MGKNQKVWKRVISVLLVFVILLSVVPLIPVTAETAGSIYTEYHQTDTLVWSSTGQWSFDTVSGTVTAPAAVNKPLYLHEGKLSSFQSYTLEADVTLPDNTATLGGICFGVQDQGDVISRYEFTVSYYNGGWCPRIYKRVVNVDGYSGYICDGGHQTANSSISITPGVPFTMKITLDGLKMTASINGTQVLSYNVGYSYLPWNTADSSYDDGAIMGGAALIGFNNAAAEFDNVKISSNDAVVFVDDFSRNESELYTGSVIFQDDFSEKDASWQGGTYSTNGLSYNFSASGGTASVTAPQTGTVDVPMSVSLMRPENELANVTEYCVRADACIIGNSNTPTTREGMAAVQFAKTSTTGEIYELRLTSGGKVQLYQGSTLLMSKTLKAITGTDFSFGKAYSLFASVYGNVVSLYVDGYLVGYYAGLDSADGYGAIRAIAGSVNFDDFVTAQTNTKEDTNLVGIAVYSLESGAPIGNEAQCTFHTEDYLLICQYLDGTTKPIPLSQATVSEYDPTSSERQQLIVSYGGKSCSVYYEPALFRDSFTANPSARWSAATADGLSHRIDNGTLKFTATSAASVRWQVSDGSQWENYIASADICFDTQELSTTRYFGLISRYADNSWYEFRVIGHAAGAFSAVLARFDNGSYVLLQSYTDTQMRLCGDYGSNITTGKTYSIKLSVTDNLIKVYFNGGLLGSYRDTSENALYTGTAGMRVINNSCTVDNYVVTERGDGTIQSLKLSQFPDGNVTLWQGNDIELWNNNLVVTYADGTVESVMLKKEMLKAFDSSILGTQELVITYEDQSFSIPVTVTAQADGANSIAKTLTAFDAALTESNISAFLELKAQYDSLSPYVLETIDETLTEKYHLLLQQYDLYIAPELSGEDILLNDFLNESVLNHWGDSVEGNGGTWMQTNGVLYQAQRPYGKVATGWKCPDLHGNLTAVSADLAMLSDYMQAGIVINVSGDGYYYACVDNSTSSGGSRSYVLQLRRKSGQTTTVVASAKLSDFGITLSHGVWFHLLMTLDGNTIRVYCNEQELISFAETETLLDTGEAGIRIYRGDALTDNLRIYGTEVARADSSELIEPYTYTDDFEDETVGSSPSHWVETSTQGQTVDYWRIFEKNGNVYGTQAGGDTQTYLYAFDNDPVIRMDFMVESLQDTGSFGFITRLAPSTAYVYVGYDAAQQKWYVKEQTSEAEGETITYQDGAFLLETQKWYTAELILDQKDIYLTIDGDPVLSMESLVHTGYGRVGFFTQDAALYIDDCTVTFSTGDIPQDGVISYVIDEDTYNNMFEIETFDDGNTLLGVGIASKFVSEDAGLTWTEVTNDSTYAQIIAGNYTTLLEMSNGQYMQILMNDEMKVQISDDLLNWETVSNIVSADEYKNSAGSLVTLVHVNTATEVTLENGGSRIFAPIAYRKYQDGTKLLGHYTEVYYSDDFGFTWQKSTNNTLDVLPGATETDSTSWAESKVIKCADGSLRMYCSRNKLGCMQYTVSYDEGITWEGLHQIPEIQLPMTSYAIMEDPTAEGSFYMVCCIGTPAALGQSTPRTRFVLLRSTDGMNWEFLMNLERMTEYKSTQNSVSLYQILDPSLLITKDYVYVTMGRSEREYSENDARSHQAQRIYYVRIEKNKLSSRPWDASTVADMYYPKTVEFETAPHTQYDLGEALLYEGSLKLTDFFGNQTFVPISENCTIYDAPDMGAAGEYSVELRYSNGTDLGYTVNVTDSYMQTHTICTEDFDGGMKQSWTGAVGNWTLDADNGVYISPANTSPVYMNKDGLGTISDYVLEAQITLPENISNSTQLGGICFGVQDSGNVTSRYEFTVTYKDGLWCPRIYKRVSNVSGYSGVFCAGDYQTADERINITPGVPFVMKVALDGLNMKCYIDDVLIFDYTVSTDKDAALSEGAVVGGVGLLGFRTAGVKYDDVKLYTQTPIGYREFFTQADEESLNDNGWFTEGTAYTGAAYQSAFCQIAENDGNRYLQVRNRNYSLVYDTGENDGNYVFQADLFYENAIVAADGTQTAGTAAENGHTGIFFGVDEETGLGYEFCLILQNGTWKCRLYNRADTGINITAVLPEGITFDENTVLTLRAVLDGATVHCYINGKLAISHTRSDGQIITGDAALVSRLGGTNSTNDLLTGFDNVIFLHTPAAKVIQNSVAVDAYATADEAINAVEGIDYGGDVTVQVLSCKAVYIAEGRIVAQFYLTPGESVTNEPAIPDRKGYSCAWDQKVENIAGDMTVTAVYTPYAAVDSWNLTLGDDIGVNFRVYIQDGYAEDTVAKITVAGETKTVYPSELTPEDGSYVIKVNMAAAQMTDIINVEIICGDLVIQREYTVLQYAKEILNGEYSQTVKQLVREMLNYGTAAQIYFGYRGNNLANAGLDLSGVGNEGIPQQADTAVSVTGFAEGIRFYGATLVFTAKTGVRFYFTANSGVDSYTFTVGDSNFVPAERNGMWYIEAGQISPQNLNDTITLRISKGEEILTVTYGPMNYIVRMNANGTDALKALLKAMYNYHLAAAAYTNA